MAASYDHLYKEISCAADDHLYKEISGAADDAWNELPVIPSSSNVIVDKQLKLTGSREKTSSSSRQSHEASVCLTIREGVCADSRSIILELPPVILLEIFKHLDARGLSIISCVCSLFRILASDNHGWKDFYCERWGLPVPSKVPESSNHLGSGKSWRELYLAREARCKALMGRFRMDMLYGHSAAVRAVRMLPAANLAFSSGYDSTVRIWDLAEGLPITSSCSFGETIRAIAVDMDLLAVGGTDSVIRLWRAIPKCPHLFDISNSFSTGSETSLCGHTGPVTCLGLDFANLYSGSWDMSIKVWDRTNFGNSKLNLAHGDWVWSLVVRGHKILSTAGSDVYKWDAETGQLLRVRRGVHQGQAYAIEGSRSGHYVISGGEDGAVRMFDDRIPSRSDTTAAEFGGCKDTVAAWIPHTSAVLSLAFDDPWLLSASGEGTLAMMDLRHAMKKGPSIKVHRPVHSFVVKEGDTVQRYLTTSHQSAYSVDIGADKIISGGEERTIRVWDFSQALEIERRVQAAKDIRQGQRIRRKQGAAAIRECKSEHVGGKLKGVDSPGQLGIAKV